MARRSRRARTTASAPTRRSAEFVPSKISSSRKRAGGGALRDVHHLADPLDLRVEARLAVLERVLDADRRAHGQGRQAQGARAHGGAGLGQHRVDADRAQQRALPGHVGAGDHQHLALARRAAGRCATERASGSSGWPSPSRVEEGSRLLEHGVGIVRGSRRRSCPGSPGPRARPGRRASQGRGAEAAPPSFDGRRQLQVPEQEKATGAKNTLRLESWTSSQRRSCAMASTGRLAVGE